MVLGAMQKGDESDIANTAGSAAKFKAMSSKSTATHRKVEYSDGLDFNGLLDRVEKDAG